MCACAVLLHVLLWYAGILGLLIYSEGRMLIVTASAGKRHCTRLACLWALSTGWLDSAMTRPDMRAQAITEQPCVVAVV